MTIHVTFSNPKNNAISKSTVCITSPFAPANDCVVRSCFLGQFGWTIPVLFSMEAVNLNRLPSTIFNVEYFNVSLEQCVKQ